MKIYKLLSLTYGIIVLALARCLSMELLEAGIVLLLMYEVGFEFDFIDNMMEVNNKIDRYLAKLAKRIERKLHGRSTKSSK
jgi:hypothetical protein